MINVIKLHKELLLAVLPVIGVSDDGRVDYSRELTPDEQTLANTIISKHDPNPSYDEQRKQEYEKAGITSDALIVALWEKLIENRPEAANDLQAKREIIKNRIPKPLK